MIALIIISILFLDQLTKFFITKHFVYTHTVPLINGIFHITLVHNRGAAFGILKNQLPLFIATSVCAIVLIIASLKRNASYRVALSLILAGALGNLIDRVCLGYVIDFLDFRIWPVFNVADSAITIGAIVLAYSILRSPSHQVTKPHE